jgi:Mg-chelatase subunit ChlD
MAMCLVVDRSGSMNGTRLATAAVTAAACLVRAPGDTAVVTFARHAEVLAPLGVPRDPERVVTDVLGLRGHGMTSVSEALAEARSELARSRAARKVTVLLSDCRCTDDVDPGPSARALEELVILAPADDADEAHRLARESAARIGEVASVDGVASLLEQLLQT